MSTEEQAEAALRLHAWLADRLDDLSIPKANRQFLAILCFDQTIEHLAAAGVLLRHRIAGTAFTLPRLVFDTFVRGSWLLYCASDGQVADYRRDEHRLQFGDMLSDLENDDGFEEQVLSKLKTNSWNAMNSYAHSGMFQLSRRTDGTEIFPNYDEKEVVEVLKLCGTFALMAFQQIAIVAGKGDLAEEALRLLEEGGPLR